jgi:hypothetical protein
MTRTAVIHQPDFLPYLGFFHRFLHANLYVALDVVQFSRRSWHNRDTIKSPRGQTWVTVPIQKADYNAKINEILLSDASDWRNEHLNFLKENYKKAKYFSQIFPRIEKLYAFQCAKMMDFNLESIKLLLNLFNIDIDILLASSLHPLGKSNELLVDILNKANCDTYLSGLGAKAYYDPAPFEKSNIKVVWQEFAHPEYPQLYGPFIPNLSAIDLFFNCGIEESRLILGSA